MTKINKIVMRGFKSFATRTELVFGNNFNCILGPNGSGKSNVLDALCFVLGKGSAKGLRAEKSANLICNGGKTKNPAKEGEVSIYFDNSKKTFPTDKQEIKITRIIKQSGQSRYKINDKTRTRQQILELLSLAKINPDSYNIILQGDIVRFVEMPSIERRQIVEEIAGISVYEEKKGKALKELEKVETKVNEAEIILAERETHLKELKKDRDYALKYKKLNDKINENRASYLNLQIKKKEDELAKCQNNMNSYESKIKGIQEKISKLKEEVEQKKSLTKEITKQIEEKGEKEQVAVHKEVERLRVDIATNKTRSEAIKNELNRLVQRKNQLQASLAELEERITSLNSEKNKLEEKKSAILKEQTEMEKRISNFKKKHKLDSTVDIEKELDEIDTTIEEKQKGIQELREEQQNLFREKDKLELKIQGIDEKIEKVIEVEKEHKEQITDLKLKKQRFKKAGSELSRKLDENSYLSSQLGTARERLLYVNEELSKLKARSVHIKDKILGDSTVKKILEQKGKLGKIYGTVSELGQVSSKYALALEIAAGPKIKSVVVEDDKTAANCIRYLKENKLGIATFLPLNKLKHVEINQAVKKLSNAKSHGMALDLISYNPKFKKVFSYVFGNCLVVDDMATARRIGIGLIRMVTLDGDVAERSGAMRGGHRTKRLSLGFKEKEVMSEIEKREKETADLKAVVSRLEKNKKANENAIIRLRKEKAELEGEIIKIERSLHLDSTDTEVSKSQKKELKNEIAEIDKRIAEIQKKVSALNKELVEQKTKKQELRDVIAQLKNPALIAELNTFNQKKEEFKEDIIKIDSDIKGIDIQINDIFKRDKENTLKILKQHDREEEEFNNELKHLKEKLKKQESEIKTKEVKEKQFYSQFKTLFNKRDKLNKEVQELEIEIIRKGESIRTIEHKCNTISLENAKLKAELAAIKEDFKRYGDVNITTKKTEQELKKEIDEFEKLVNSLGSVNMRALEIYDSVEKEYKSLLEKKEKLKLEKEDILIMINEIESKKKELFMRTFNSLNDNFKNTFKALSTKGDASLELENANAPFEGGVRIKVRLTGNKFLDIRSLSGGEKTLTALTLIFAIQEHEPASFYVFDEVDAALDKKNSEKLAKLLRKYSENAQYIIISHNDSIISESDYLYGISMNEHGMSNVVSLKI